MKYRVIFYMTMLLVSLTSLTNAFAGSATGTVDQVYTYGDGRVLVTGFTFSNNNCSHN